MDDESEYDDDFVHSSEDSMESFSGYRTESDENSFGRQNEESETKRRNVPMIELPSVEEVVSKWNEKFYKSELTTEDFKEHWRYFIPRTPDIPDIFSATTPIDSGNKHVALLFDTLEQFMSNCSDPKSFFKKIEAETTPAAICNRIFTMSEPTYYCKDCGIDATCVLCVNCFTHSEHRYHRYKMGISYGGGCCDCGDAEAWSTNPTCNIHLQVTEGNEVMECTLPEEIMHRTRLVFDAILHYAYRLLTFEHTPDLPSDLNLKLDGEEGNDPLSYLSRPDDYCTILYNDETHTFDNVISILTKVVKCSHKEAVEYVGKIDREGRAVVKSAAFSKCKDIKLEIEKTPSRNSNARPLKVIISHTYVVAHQMFALRLLHWMNGILKTCRFFRQVFAEAITCTGDPPECTVILKGILKRDAFLWKDARAHWHRLFITGMLMEYENKKLFAVTFAQHYGCIIKDFIRDDHDVLFSVESLAVQIFTVPSIAHQLIAHYDVLYVFFTTYLSECNPSVKGNHLQFNRQDLSMLKRAHQILVDVGYVLTTVPREWTKELRVGMTQGMTAFTKLLEIMQGMDSVTRQSGQHMEYEQEWETAFNMHLKLTPVIASMLKWCCSDKEVLVKAYRKLLRLLAEPTHADTMRITVMVEFANHSASCIHYDVSSKPVSIHIPLTRFLAGLHLGLEAHGLTFDSSELQLVSKEKLTPVQIIEPALRTMVMISQVHAGLWRRNGYSILHQIYFYHNVRCRSEMQNKDVLMAQIGASLVESNEFLLHVLNKFQLTGWLQSDYEASLWKKTEEDSIRQTICVVEEFFTTLIVIVGERYMEGVGCVQLEDCVKNELIQHLCIRPHSHSELRKYLADNKAMERLMDPVLSEIAVFQEPQGISKGLYKLKPDFQKYYNMYFYHYTREDMSKAEEEQRRVHKQKTGLDCCPPPPLPPLKAPFIPLVNLLQCDVMLSLMKIVLERTLDLKSRTFSEPQFQRVLYLIGYALHEEQGGRYNFFKFTAKAVEYGIKRFLEHLVSFPRVEVLRDYVKWTLAKFSEVEGVGENYGTSEMDVDDVHALSEQANAREMEKKRKSQLAEQSRQRLMKQMKDMQKSFIADNKQLYDEACDEKTKTAEDMYWQQADENPIALGMKRTPAPIYEPRQTCILCQEDQTITTEDDAMVYAAYVQKSTVLSHPLTKVEKNNANYFLSANLGPALFTSSCGHIMHGSCYEKFFKNISTKENRRPYRFRQAVSFDVEKREYPCPLCESLCNTVLPLLPPLHTISYRQFDVEEHLDFTHWLRSVIMAGSRKRRMASKMKQAEAERKQAEAERKQIEVEGMEKMEEDGNNKEETSTASGDSVQARVEFPHPHGDLEIEVVERKEQRSDSCSDRMSHSLKSMIMDYELAVYRKAKNVAVVPEDSGEECVMLCWKTCAYTIHAIERLIRESRTKSLLGDFQCRQKDCIEAMIRIGALQGGCYRERLTNKMAVDLLSILFDAFTPAGRVCLIDWDPFGILVSLTFSLLSLFYVDIPTPIPKGTIFEQYTFMLMLVASITQALIATPIPDILVPEGEEFRHPETDGLKVIFAELPAYKGKMVRTDVAWDYAKKTVHPFLRCCVIFYHLLTGVPAPKKLKILGGDTFEEMCGYFGVLPTCSNLFEGEEMQDTVGLWVRDVVARERELNAPVKLEGYLQAKNLITFPEDYCEFMNNASRFLCPKSKEESKNPAICLTCGAVLCSQSYCCQEDYDNHRTSSKMGACMQHAVTCGAGAGLFLRIRECEVLLLSFPNRGCFIPAPYLDQYGETDQGLRRGNPLMLCPNRYKALKVLWLSHGIHDEVSRTMESAHSLATIQWQNL